MVTFEVESLLLEAADDLANEAPLDAVGLDHDEGLLQRHCYRKKTSSSRFRGLVLEVVGAVG